MIEKLEKIRSSMVELLNRKIEDDFEPMSLIDKGLPKDIINYANALKVAGVDIGRSKNNSNNLVVRIILRIDQKLAELQRLWQLVLSGENPGSDANNETYIILILLRKVMKEAADRPGGSLDPENLEFLLTSPELQNVKPGGSVSHPRNRSGTISGIVFKNGTGEKMILSCWHVLAHEYADNDHKTLSPGMTEVSNSNRPRVGKLHSAELFPDSRGDVAISLLDPETKVDLMHQWKPQGHQAQQFLIESHRLLTEASIGSPVYVPSRKTNHSMAILDGVGTYFMHYDGIGTVGIDGFRLVPQNPGVELTLPGDSGTMSFIKDGDKYYGVGIHFAGEPKSEKDPEQEYALASHLGQALEKLGVSLTEVEAWPQGGHGGGNNGHDQPVPLDPLLGETNSVLPKRCHHCGEKLSP